MFKQKERYAIKDLEGKTLETFRYRDTANNEISELKKRYGELKIEKINHG